LSIKAGSFGRERKEGNLEGGKNQTKSLTVEKGFRVKTKDVQGGFLNNKIRGKKR